MPVETDLLVDEVILEFEWFPGFSVQQKQRSAREMHSAAAAAGFEPVLEVSSKSWDRLGSRLSAFHLQVDLGSRRVPVETAFQAGKVYEDGGPYVDLLELTPREARKDERHASSGALLGFRVGDVAWSLASGTLFYDFLYLRAIRDNGLSERLRRFAGFSDIEFNPKRSLNCQARSSALSVSLENRGLLEEAIADQAVLLDLAKSYTAAALSSNPSLPSTESQGTLGM